MGAQGSKSSGESSQFSPYAPILARFATERLKAEEPVLNQLTSQTSEALRTGGVNAQIPIVNRSLDAARSAYSTSMEQTRQALARSGLSGSSWAQQLLASNRMEGEQNIAKIPTTIASEFISGAPQLGLDTGGMSGLSEAMQGNMNRDFSTSTTSWNTQFSDLAKILGAASGGGSFGSNLGNAY